ncbi:hypothetical protein GCM10007904_35700 [Oharaeibacter diazotrophicus]|nr:hypothetical protein GCM10007904_35700 [Oharaeibacter diazotrophicus]
MVQPYIWRSKANVSGRGRRGRRGADRIRPNVGFLAPRRRAGKTAGRGAEVHANPLASTGVTA